VRMNTTITSNHVSETGLRSPSRTAGRRVGVFPLACATVSLLAYLALSDSIRTFGREFIRLVGKTF